MSFEELATFSRFLRVKACSRVRVADQSLLSDVAGHRDACRFAILVHPCLPDDTLDVVTIKQRLAESLEDDGAHAFLIGISKIGCQKLTTES